MLPTMLLETATETGMSAPTGIGWGCVTMLAIGYESYPRQPVRYAQAVDTVSPSITVRRVIRFAPADAAIACFSDSEMSPDRFVMCLAFVDGQPDNAIKWARNQLRVGY